MRHGNLAKGDFTKVARRHPSPTNNDVRNLVGMGQYRVGEYAMAIDVLSQSDRIYVSDFGAAQPFNLAYLAMAYHKGGDIDKAHETLIRLNDLMESTYWRNHPRFDAYRRMQTEAESLIQEKSL